MRQYVDLVAVVPLPMRGVARGERFKCESVAARRLVETHRAEYANTDDADAAAGHYQTRQLTPGPGSSAAPPRVKKTPKGSRR